ncbi:glycosyltransferase family 4 protein [Metabacillus iocasae]|uniref:Glycosyltransferase involved in cell wall biosynthesis n=1 Tax=Priestia iocasae TaxID=2291674 RepID=A0ABS2QY15_9BACI|nr:glycosyltransferase family 4 protein [Metabacillus iocasae]MBM7704380.1 glycosyltransferase involved in cell wall biosynthesis [Metabacillus iocasae]
MKLAYICTEKLPAPGIKGGAIQMMIDGVSPFLSKKHDFTIFSITDPDLPDQETRDGVTYIRFPQEHYRFSVARELKRHNFDVIHVFNRPKHVLLYKASSPKSRFVLSLHNDMFSEQKISYKLGYDVIEQVDFITTVSHYIEQEIINRFPKAAAKTKVTYSGVDLASYPPVWTQKGQHIRNFYRKKYGVEDKKVLLFVGRLSKTKGPDLLIRALEKLIQKHDNLVLMIVGSKWFSNDGTNAYVHYLYQLASRVKDHVIFTKFIHPDEIPNMFLLGDIFVCSSQWNEPLARVHYESMAAGTPLITTNRGGNTEVVKDGYNGIVVDQYDLPSSFVKAIDRLITEPSLAEEMARNGREYVESMFQFYHVAERYNNVYEEAYTLKKITSY